MDEQDVPRRRLVRTPTGGDPAGRSLGARVKTADSRSLSSTQWLDRQLNDPYVKAAKAAGYLHVLRRGVRIIDLGCAPGGWVQVAVERGAGAVAGVDLLHVEPIPPATLIEGDFTDPAIPPRLLAAIGGPPDLVLSDMAPNTSGHRKTDHLRIVGLIEAAADFAIAHLKPGGAFITKAFQGGETESVLRVLKAAFDEVKHVKPKASRQESSEVYLAALGRRIE